MSSRPISRTRARRAGTGAGTSPASRPHHEHHPSTPPPAVPPPTPELLAPTTSASTPPLQGSYPVPDLSNLNLNPPPPDAQPTPKKLVIKLILNPKPPITLAVRIPGLSHTAPTLAAAIQYPAPAASSRGEGNEHTRGEIGEEADTPLKEGTVCVSEFIKEEDIEAMPSLEAPLTRKRRRASSVVETFVQLPAVKPRGRRRKDVVMLGEALVNGTGSNSVASKPEPKLKAEKLKGEVLTNGINGGGHKHDMLIEIESGVVDKKKSTKPKEMVKEPEKPKLEEGKDGKKEKEKADREKDLERNIDNVIFGDVTFKAWYPSWYPKEIIGEKALSCTVEGKGPGITVKDLYVCRKCFGYSKVLVDWVRHCRCCEREVPGQKVYSHGSEGEGGGWSIWEVDGGVETLFCQNLSLFAKLFLDNKSVFFDVSGFNYFLLVHTSPHTLETQIIGFFSKEKMSWDNNNLACILIFPPWQRKGLGALLMGVSYAIAKREGIMGGPEKPISDLGKKGYRRYWGAEIARWLLGVRDTDRKKGKGMVDVERISKETWIAPDDCLNVLREMGVVEKAGRGKGTVERVRIDKARVREWVEKERLGLERVVDEEGFVEGYAMRAETEEVEEVEEEVEEE